MDMTTVDRNNMVEKRTQAASLDAAELEMSAMDDALWRMAQNNAMAKIKGFNTIAKMANDL